VGVFVCFRLSVVRLLLSLAIPPWVGTMSTGDGFGHLWEETAPLKLRRYGAR